MLDCPSNFRMEWTILNSTHIRIGMSAETEGWLSVGLSAGGTNPMISSVKEAGDVGSDIWLGWIDHTTGGGYVADQSSHSYHTPPNDPEWSQDLTLVDSSRKDGVMRIDFVRRLDTGDAVNDRPIDDSPGAAPIPVIWGYNPSPTAMRSADGSSYHEHTGLGKGTTSVRFVADDASHTLDSCDTACAGSFESGEDAVPVDALRASCAANGAGPNDLFTDLMQRMPRTNEPGVDTSSPGPCFANSEGTFKAWWAPATDATSDTPMVDITMSARVDSSGWVGIGFGTQPRMHGSDMFVGWINEDTGDVSLADRFSTGHSFTPLDLLHGGTNDAQPLELGPGGVRTGYADGWMTISFRRPAGATDAHDVDLTAERYVLWATGGAGSVNYYTTTPDDNFFEHNHFGASDDPLLVTDAQCAAITGHHGSEAQIAAHAVLMLVGWFFFLSTGAVIAKYRTLFYPTAKQAGHASAKAPRTKRASRKRSRRSKRSQQRDGTFDASRRGSAAGVGEDGVELVGATQGDNPMMDDVEAVDDTSATAAPGAPGAGARRDKSHRGGTIADSPKAAAPAPGAAAAAASASAKAPDAWFTRHYYLQMFGTGLVIAGFVFVYLHLQAIVLGWHQALGFVAIAGALAQVVLGYCRPPGGNPPSTKRRRWFLAHRVVSTVAFLCAAVAVFLGLDMYSAPLAVWVLVIAHFVVTLALMAFSQYYYVVQQEASLAFGGALDPVTASAAHRNAGSDAEGVSRGVRVSSAVLSGAGAAAARGDGSDEDADVEEGDDVALRSTTKRGAQRRVKRRTPISANTARCVLIGYYVVVVQILAVVALIMFGVVEVKVQETFPASDVNLCTHMEDYPVPLHHTRLICRGFRFPPDASVHITDFKPMIDHPEYVHHMILYKVKDAPVGSPYECEEMPEGSEPIYGWAPGAPGFVMPDNVGFRVGAAWTDGFGNTIPAVKWAVLQIHYINPNHDHVIDNTGVFMHLSPQLRPIEAGIFKVGVQPQMVSIPADKSGYGLAGTCSAPLVELPAASSVNAQVVGDRFTVFSYMLHMHNIGKRMWVEQRRGGERLVDAAGGDVLGHEDFFDSQYERFYASPQATLQAGDALTAKCVWENTAANGRHRGNDVARDGHTVHGCSTDNCEMCLSYMFYYPRLPPAMEVGCISDDVDMFCDNDMDLMADGTPAPTCDSVE